MRQHCYAYLIGIRKLLPLVLIPIARAVYGAISGTPVDIILSTDVAVTAVLILFRVVRVWAVKLTVTNDNIYIEKGILVKSKSTVPPTSTTMYYVNQSLLLRFFKVSKLQIFTKSGRVARLYLSKRNLSKLSVSLKLLA